ncbi:UrcA family protein [Aurantiacibacter sp. MUD61]|uniref:UrcA family protein n=1 Tax=Aurantiacibacter sp. MUD61 TaxID=3009083 RepID=UPI0022F04567|nr:UrcA family protein [Aurantiacibacter sp. MUD61]
MTKTLTTLLALGLATASFAAPVHAQDDSRPDVRQIAVDFSDLDISDAGQMQELRTRVDRAVRRLCPARIEGPVRTLPNARQCRSALWEEAEVDLANLQQRTLIGQFARQTIRIGGTREERDLD